MATPPKAVRKRRPAYQRKQVQFAHKSMRGVPETVYGELKKIASFSLTPTATQKLKLLSRELDISASELLERVARQSAAIKPLLEPETKPAEASVAEG